MAERINYKYFMDKYRETHSIRRGTDGIHTYKRYISEALGRNDLSDFRLLRTISGNYFVIKCYLPDGTLKRIGRRNHNRRIQDGG